MGCFLAPVAEAIVVSVIKKKAVRKEQAAALQAEAEGTVQAEAGIPVSRKLGWLTKMLWGGSGLLLVEHIWHGEIVPWPPFLTAMSSPAEAQALLMEIITVGGAMMAVVTAAWLAMVLIADRLEKKASRPEAAKEN